MADFPEPITVAIPTRDRGTSIIATLESVFRAGDEVQCVLVIDQSENDDTVRALERFANEPRLKYVRSDVSGVSNSRNKALQLAATNVVFMTDDDCILPENYAPSALRVLALHPDAGIIFFRVEAAPYDETAGYTPVFLPKRERLVTHIGQLAEPSGLTAGICLRRSIVQGVGGFDTLLGAGGRFKSGEDIDIAVRILLDGHSVFETDAVTITHFGFRTMEQFRTLVRRDWYGIGAAYAKPLRAGHWSFTRVIAADLWKRSIKPLLFNLIRLRPHGFASLKSFIGGFRDGWRQPLDRRTLTYKA